MIKSLVTKESCAPQTQRCWIPAQGRNDGGGVGEAVAPAADAPGLFVFQRYLNSALLKGGFARQH
ncbi:hypothetical protein ASF69_01295 [Rhizobium sp. Leaf311]|nr:hypothetical protein ASF69_01295 [Rhizobium sp. Leaf311]